MHNKKLLLSLASLCCSIGWAQVAQVWNFTEDGTTGIADNKSDQGLAAQFFGTDTNGTDTVAFDGGFTVSRANGTSGDRPLGIALNDTNATEVILSVTLASWDFSTGTTDEKMSFRLRNDVDNQSIGDLSWTKQDANSRMRITGLNTAGVAVNAESGGPITFGITLDLVADTYTYWIGTPLSGSDTWGSRFANHTGSVVGLGETDIDSIQWSIGGHTTTNSAILDQIQVSYTAVPEPSTMALLAGLGALGLVIHRRRRQ